MATKSKSAFGARENISAALDAGKIDAYDVIYMTNGEIGWVNKDGEVVYNTPRTQEEIISFNEDVVIPAGTSLDELVSMLSNTLLSQLKAETLAEANEYADSASGNSAIVEF